MGLPTIDDAQRRILACARSLADETVPLAEALDRVLAEDVTAAHDVPRFANSAMDGFAAAAGPAGRSLPLAGESRAGRPLAGTLAPGTAARISTGAALPEGADGVLQLELAEDAGDHVLLGEPIEPGRNVRRPGEDVRAGERVLAAGTVLGPAELAVAAAAGRAELRCVSRPRVAIVATGDELRPPGTPLGPGELHETNALALTALTRRAGAEPVSSVLVGDDPGATREALAAALDAAHVVLCSGGVSVGPHDHVKPALEELGVEEVLWRVALRPGKPTWFGHRDDTLVFGLPGNPVSAMVTFALFARPALRALQGLPPLPARARGRLAVALPRHPARDECVRVRLDHDRLATPTGAQGSHRISSMVGADALAIVPRGDGELAAGAEVDLEPLG